MSVEVHCPHCGASYPVAENKLGKSPFCKKCEQAFAYPPSAVVTQRPQAGLETGRNASARPAPQRPETLGRFEIRSKLGAGAFGAVYRAYDPLLEREVALKVPHPGALESEKDKVRYLREPKAAAQLRHPNIVPIFDAGVDGEQFFIASAFIEGHTLQHALETQRPDLRGAASIVMKLAGALDYAHSLGIVHRDVKPANIMLDNKGEPHLMDFGLAQIRAAEDKLTHDGTVLGTPAYMSPEQARGDSAQIGSASDQYSLGVVLYELLCGERPFSGPPALVISLVQNQEPESPRKHNAKIPKDLETICLKAVAKEANRRFTNCDALQDDLRRWVAGEPIQARRQGLLERSVRWCRRNPVAAGALALLLLVLVTATAVSTRFAIQARSEKRTAFRRLYASDMLLAQQAWDDARINRVRQLLDGQRPEQTNGVDLRGFEWHFWQRQCHSELLTLRHPGSVYGAAFSLDGKKLASAHSDGSVKVWHAATGKEMLSLTGHAPMATSVAFSPDGDRLACGTGNTSELGQAGQVKVWELATGREIHSFEKHSSSVRQVAFSPSGGQILSFSAGGYDRTNGKNSLPELMVWDAFTGKVNFTFEQKQLVGKWGANIFAAVFDPNGNRLLTVSRDGNDESPQCKVWNLSSGEETQTIPILSKELFPSMAFSADGKRLASAGASHGVQVWDLPTGEKILNLQGHSDSVYGLAFSPDGRRLASGSHDRTVKIWDLTSGRAVSLRGHTSLIYHVVFSSDSLRLASSGADSTVRIWSSTTDPEGLSLQGQVVAISPDGMRVATATR